MRCPFCDARNPKYVLTTDIDESSCSIQFYCEVCNETFWGEYSFMYYEDNEGNEVC